MSRFVILRHETPPGAPRGTHWDFMLEQEGSLRTWALEREPQSDQPIAAQELAVHRVAYLQYEGPISGDRGSVMRWDEGTFVVLRESSDALELSLAGRRVRGGAQLSRDPNDPVQWTFRLASDDSLSGRPAD